MVALAFTFLLSLAASVYLVARNRKQWGEMTFSHRWMVLMVCLNTAILGVALVGAIGQSS